MFTHIRQQIQSMVQADDASLDFVLSHFKELHVPRNQILLREGEICRSCYFINSGCVQAYAVNEEGEEVTRDIFLEKQWFTNIESFSKEIPSKEFYRTIEHTTVLQIDRQHFFILIGKVPQFMEAYRQILESSYEHSISRINTFNGMDAAGRLQWLYQHQPALMLRIPNRIIASYIGISPETLSRLKGKR